MAELKTVKYIREVPTRPSNHKEVTSPILFIDTHFALQYSKQSKG